MSTTETTVLPTLRKRWNPPQVPETPKTKLPLFRKNSMPTVTKESHQVKKNTIQAKNSLSAPRLNIQNKLPDCSTKPLTKTKEIHIELATLKKELSTVKAENSALKARVRRIEDENSQKSRQIDKLQAEIKNELIVNRKNKENESVLVLRQKCIRLDNVLREKDQAIKKLVSELHSIKLEELKDIIQKYHKELGIPNGVGTNVLRGPKLVPQTGDAKPASKQSRTHIIDKVSKSETEKLRNIIHKLQSENHYLQTQSKEKDQEIRRLKCQIQRQNSKSNINGSLSKLSRRSSTPRSSSPVTSKPHNLTSTTSLTTTKKPVRTPVTVSNATKVAKQPIASVIPSNKNSTFVVKKPQSVLKQKAIVQKPSVETEKMKLEIKVQSMRENIAARKIQQGWRKHQNKPKQSLTVEQEKALGVILNQLKAHKSKKEKLLTCSEENNDIAKMSTSNVESVTLKISSCYETIINKSI